MAMVRDNLLWKTLEGEMVNTQYHLKKLLGSGGFGGVFLADEILGDRLLRRVALKLITPCDKYPGKQLEEFKAATNLNHPHLLRGLATGYWRFQTDRHFFYLVTEVADDNLESCLEKGTLSPFEIQEITYHLAKALDYLHTHNPSWVHRDLKPANILKVKDTWQLGDYGLITCIASPTACDIPPMGTRAYAPPECYDSIVACAWDVWSLGIIIYEMFRRELPFNSEASQELKRLILTQQPPGIEQLPAPFAEIVRGCLQKNYQKRLCAKDILKVLDNHRTNQANNTTKRPYQTFYQPKIDVFNPF